MAGNNDSNGNSFDKSVIKRYENKYLIHESLCEKIRKHISFFCVPDPKAADTNGFYYVHSLYFDTPSLTFYWDNKLKATARLKPRVRYFGLKPKDYAWLEVKRRVKNVVWKKREKIPIELWPSILHSPSNNNNHELEDYLNGGNGSSIERSLDSFVNVVNAYGAIPAVHVRYLREAYMSEIDNYIRITFDRRLSGCLAHGKTDLHVDDNEFIWIDDPVTSQFSESPVIMEIKCEMSFPQWVTDLIQRFQLIKQGFSKYCNTLEKARAEFCGEKELRVPRNRH